MELETTTIEGYITLRSVSIRHLDVSTTKLDLLFGQRWGQDIYPEPTVYDGLDVSLNFEI